jgi:alkylation response protein AidB-like acyl-CoA dehydrogenase
LGKIGDGLKIALRALDITRIGAAAMSLGIARAAFEAAVSYGKSRTAFGQPIWDYQAIGHPLVDIATEIEAASMLTYNAATMLDNDKPFTKEASMAKLYASELAVRAALHAIQVHGGSGYMKDLPVERYLRDALAMRIMYGTSEIQKLVIGRMLQ